VSPNDDYGGDEGEGDEQAVGVIVLEPEAGESPPEFLALTE